MRISKTLLSLWFAGAVLATGGCNGSGAVAVIDPPEPQFAAQRFGARPFEVTNPYFPLEPGTAYTFTVETEDGVETIVVEVLDETRVVAGIVCAVVRDRVYLDELLIEDTHDWYAQDLEGNVWYMGEEVVNYEYDEEGNLLGTDNDGAWEAGLDVAGTGSLAEPGILMKAVFVVGDTYRQEYYPGEAEDMGEIVAVNVTVVLEDGSSFPCVQIRDTTPLEPGVFAFKYFAPGVGLVLEEEDGDRVELRGVFDVSEASLPEITAATFSNPSGITHPYLNFAVGNTFEYEVETDDGLEEILVEVLDETRVVDGIECRVVRDRVWLDGLLVEDTHDWFAQDDAGNVWYMGEEVENFEYDEMGNLVDVNDDGAWEAGVDGAEAGILIRSTQVVGSPYRQEYYEDEAEDMAVVVSTSVAVVLGGGTTYPGCLQTLEWTPLEPFALEYKFYASGVGLVAEQPVGGGERVELTGP